MPHSKATSHWSMGGAGWRGLSQRAAAPKPVALRSWWFGAMSTFP